MASHSQAPTLREDVVPTTSKEKLAEEGQVTMGVPGVSGDTAKGFAFWSVIASLMLATFVSALDVTAVSTALPTIVNKLNGSEFVWIGSAYSLASTAFLPMAGGMADVFGRKPVMLAVLGLFTLGSGICGGASNLDMLIAGRTIQGLGSGGILALTEIILADLVPLSKRGAYIGFFGAVWAIACAAGPPIGGAFSESTWRWLFYMNVPLSGLAILIVVLFLHVKSPKDDFRTKMKRIDWTGNILIIGSTTSIIIALTWGGVRYPWDSFRVLVPLILGGVALVAAFVFEGKFAKEPVAPWELFRHRTALSGYLITFWHGIIVSCVTFYLPVYFQAVKTQSPVKSGVSFLATATTIAPGAIACGASTTIFRKYRPQHYLGWVIVTVGIGLLTLLRADTGKATWVGVQIPVGVGIGIFFPSTTFPILAPLPLSETAHALALLAFVRNFSFTWGTTIGSTVLQNELVKRLPKEFLNSFPAHGMEIAYAVIPTIPSLPEPLKTQVRTSFAESLRIVWFVVLGICGAGLLSTLPMRELPMPDVTDDQWGMKDEKQVDEKPVESP